MLERDICVRVMKDLSCPAAIEALEIGTMPGRFVKPRDGWGLNAEKVWVRIPNPVDILHVTDCIEVKAVIARTMKGMVFRPGKAFGNAQKKEMEKHNALLAVGFILDGGENTDKLVAIFTCRYWKIQRECSQDVITMDELEKLSAFTIKGTGYGKVPRGAR